MRFATEAIMKSLKSIAAMFLLPLWFAARDVPAVSAPTPTGLSKVGARLVQFTDFRRDDPYLSNGSKRKLMVRFWYPRSIANGCIPAEYASARVMAFVSWRMGISFPQITTNSCMNAPLASGKFPITVFTHAYKGTFTDYTFLFEELASRGYIVASVAHTYETSAVEFPDVALIKSVFDGYMDTDKLLKTQRTLAAALSVRSADLQFVADELFRLIDVEFGDAS